jgi:hypothetical protein
MGDTNEDAEVGLGNAMEGMKPPMVGQYAGPDEQSCGRSVYNFGPIIPGMTPTDGLLDPELFRAVTILQVVGEEMEFIEDMPAPVGAHLRAVYVAALMKMFGLLGIDATDVARCFEVAGDHKE